MSVTTMPPRARPIDAPTSPAPTSPAPTSPAPTSPAAIPEAPAPTTADLMAEIAALKAQLATAQPTDPTVTRRAYVHHTTIRFRGKDYAPKPGQDVLFPFDPQNPPEDVSGWFIEGVDYVYR